MRERGSARRKLRYAVLGHPVAHSLSPPMQNAAFEAAGRSALYEARDVPPERLRAALAELHAAGFAGLNLTLPHKEAAMPLLASATGAARAAGAANTLRRVETGWEGHATDGSGFLAWLRELDVAARGARVLVLGAGGAARSVAFSLSDAGAAEILIVNRTVARAQALAHDVAARAGAPQARAAALSHPHEAAARGRGFDLLVRAVAPADVSEEERRWWEAASSEAVALDLNYGTRASGSRALAAARRLRFEDGLGLLLHQGALSFEYWTGLRAPLDAMRAALIRAAGP